MKILLRIVVVQWLNLVIFAWFNRVAWVRILELRQQLVVYKRKSKKPLSAIWGPSILVVAFKVLERLEI
jgi:hypothetical protein